MSDFKALGEALELLEEVKTLGEELQFAKQKLDEKKKELQESINGLPENQSKFINAELKNLNGLVGGKTGGESTRYTGELHPEAVIELEGLLQKNKFTKVTTAKRKEIADKLKLTPADVYASLSTSPKFEFKPIQGETRYKSMWRIK